MSLYLKYRPKTISELDLIKVRNVLGELLVSNKLAHAYLFTGPRGAGKTSAARIMARVVNCEKNKDKLGEPCNECESCLSILNGSAVDVVEIDAASNRGIDDIRELKERIRLSPANLRKKVYIIDEVHMLTTEAFNALLKTLEEPPDHAVFILCTTESHKIPETISSRCVRVAFTKATKDEMKRSFARVVSGEAADIEDEALEAIAAAVDGSFRDGVKILDTVLAGGKKIVKADVEIIIYGSSGYKGQALATALKDKELTKALELFHKSVEDGTDLIYLLVSLIKDIKKEVVESLDREMIPLIYKLDDIARKISTSPVPAILIEMAIIDWCASNGSGNNTPNKEGNGEDQKKRAKLSETEKPLSEQKIANQSAKETGTKDAVPAEIEAHESAELASREIVEKMAGMSAEDAWKRLTENLGGESYSLGALLSKARPGVIRGDLLTIEMTHEFHKEQLLQTKFRTRVEQLISDIVGFPMRIDCEVVKPREGRLQNAPQVDSIAEVNTEENELLEAAEEIFGN